MKNEMYQQIVNIIEAAMTLANKERKDDPGRNPIDKVRYFEDKSVYIQVRDKPNNFELIISPKTPNGGYDLGNPIFAIRLQPHGWLMDKIDGLPLSVIPETPPQSPPPNWLPEWAQEMWKV